MSSDAVLVSVDRGIATLTLNRPDNRNALSAELLNGLGDAFTTCMSSDDVRVIVLTNEGNTFCAGADLKGGSTFEARFGLVEVFELMLDGPKPVVGRINGHCMGGGVGLAAACDISVASDEAKFGFTEVRIGVAPAIISVVVLPKMRRADAMELFLSGERVPASRAASVGLINHAVADVDATVGKIVEKLRLGGPLALAAAQRLVREVPGQDRSTAFEWTNKLSRELFSGAEAQDGVAAFGKRERPSWVNGRDSSR